MSKWAEYEMITTVAKKVGGPKKLVALIASGGVAIGVGFKTIYDKITKKIKSVKANNHYAYSVNKTGYINDSIKLCEGTEFIVLNRDEDAVIIAIKNTDEIYAAKYEMLLQLSDYK